MIELIRHALLESARVRTDPGLPVTKPHPAHLRYGTGA